jgi:hypothetical protein
MRRQVTIIVAVAGLSLVPAAAAGAQPAPESHLAGTTSVPGQVQPLRVTDPRSPDTRDAATLVVVPSGVIAKSSPTTPSAHDNGDGFGWGEAGMGVGGLALIAALAFGTGYAIRHRGTRAPLAH